MSIMQWLGTGIVANTKNTNTKQIMVYLPGKFPLADGKVQASAEQREKTSVDAQGNQVKSNVLMSNSVPAWWRAMGDTNRLNAPDVREGSEVQIYQVSGQDKYYWTTWGMNAKTMRCETVMFGWSANPDFNSNTVDENTDGDFNIDDFYTFMISTHTGKTTFRTSQKNGEKTIFEIMVDSMAGRLMIGGKQKNYLVLDDMEHSLMYQNADGSILSVNKKEITAYSKDKISLNGENSINLLTKVLNVQTEQWNVQANQTTFAIQNSWNVNCPVTNWVGDIFLEGGLYATEKVQSDEDVVSKVSLNGHTHGGVIKGGDNTSGPQ